MNRRSISDIKRALVYVFAGAISIINIQSSLAAVDPLPTISLVSPVGGEVWTMGNVYNIQWQSANTSGVNIDIAGACRGRIASDVHAGKGFFAWRVPVRCIGPINVTVSTNTKSPVSATTAQTITLAKPVPVQVPKPPKPAPTISLVSPVGGEVWTMGNVYNIQWQSTNTEKVNINITGACKGLIGSVPASQGSFPWKVPRCVGPINVTVSSNTKPSVSATTAQTIRLAKPAR